GLSTLAPRPRDIAHQTHPTFTIWWNQLHPHLVGRRRGKCSHVEHLWACRLREPAIVAVVSERTKVHDGSEQGAYFATSAGFARAEKIDGKEDVLGRHARGHHDDTFEVR